MPYVVNLLADLHPPLSPEREKELFQIILTMALNQIREGISEAVVIDSPLSSAWHWHLEQLTEMAKYFYSRRVRVIIIECKPKHAYSWRLKFEEYMTRYSPSDLERIPWYKPKEWEDVEKAIQINPAGYDEKSVQHHELASKLVIDPIFLSPYDKRIAEAVKYMMTRDEKDGYDVVLYHQWKQLNSSSTDLDCREHGHNIVSKSAAEEGLAVDCAFCEKQIMVSDYYYYYYCKGCSLSLHKHCAESSAPKRTRIVETHLSIRQVPTVISHVDTEEHLLTDKVLSRKFMSTIIALLVDSSIMGCPCSCVTSVA